VNIAFNFDTLEYYQVGEPNLTSSSSLHDLVRYVVWLENGFQSSLDLIGKEARVRTLIATRYLQFRLIGLVRDDLGHLGIEYCRDFAFRSCAEIDMAEESAAHVLSLFSSDEFFRQSASCEENRDCLPTLVIPAAGRSSRFPNMKPKWMLTQPNGKLMIVDCLEGLNPKNFAKVVIGLLKEHIMDYCDNSIDQIVSCFSESPFAGMIEIVVIPEQTCDQTRTVEIILREAQVVGPIILKDCDNSFRVGGNNGCADGVGYCTLNRDNEGDIFNIASKGFVDLKPNGILKNIIEKSIISSKFACSLYSFGKVLL
jgi:hypothetical protein